MDKINKTSTNEINIGDIKADINSKVELDALRSKVAHLENVVEEIIKHTSDIDMRITGLN